MDSRLLLAHLARLDAKAQDPHCAALSGHFDAALAALEAGAPLPVVDADAPPAEAAPEPDTVDCDAEQDGAWEEWEVTLLEAQLRWIEAHYGSLSEAEENFHLQNTVPSVPSAELAAFGWRGDGGAEGGVMEVEKG